MTHMDIGQPVTLIETLAEAEAGPLERVLPVFTSNPARRRSTRRRIEAGLDADLVVLTKPPGHLRPLTGAVDDARQTISLSRHL